METVQQKPYRIEERGWPTGVPALEFDTRDEAAYVFDGILAAAQSLYALRPELRLVLLGPDRSTIPVEPTGWRIEERCAATGELLAATDQGWDGPLRAEEAQDRFTRELRLHPGRYQVGSPYRLVLVGPGRGIR